MKLTIDISGLLLERVVELSTQNNKLVNEVILGAIDVGLGIKPGNEDNRVTLSLHNDIVARRSAVASTGQIDPKRLQEKLGGKKPDSTSTAPVKRKRRSRVVKVKLTCDECKKSFRRPESQFNLAQKRGAKHVFHNMRCRSRFYARTRGVPSKPVKQAETTVTAPQTIAPALATT